MKPAPSLRQRVLESTARLGGALDTAPAISLAALLAIACSIAYYGQFNRKPSGDTYGAVYTAVALVERQTIWLDHYLPFIQARSGERPYMLSRTADGHLVSKTPAAPSLQALPAVALAALAGAREGDWDRWMEAAMLTAAVTAALSVAVLFLVLTRLTTRRRALLCAGVYAFGTLTWTVAGQALWQHSGALLALTIALLALVDRRLIIAGAALAAMVAFRPSAPVIVACLLPLVGRQPMAWLRLAAGALPIALALGAFNSVVWGGPLRQGYESGERPGGIGAFGGSMIDGLGGLLISPGRGLVWYCPVLLLGALGAFVGWRTPLVRWSAVASLAYLLLMSRFIDWWGGEAFGPRLLIESFPLLIVLLAAGLDRFADARWFRWAFGLTAAWSIAVQLLAASSWPPPTWFGDHDLFLRASWWSFTDNELVELVTETPTVPLRIVGMAGVVVIGFVVAIAAVIAYRGGLAQSASGTVGSGTPGPPERSASLRRSPSPRLLLGILICALVIALGWPIQEAGWTQKAHYALVRSLADGTPRIDAYHRETGDKGYWEGHFYSVKAPGLAFASVPPYLVLEKLDLVPSNDRTAIWLLGLFTVVPFALLLLLATKSAAALLAGGRGWIAAGALAAASLVLPFSTLFFSHVPTAALAMSATYFCFRARDAGSARLAFLAGLLAGIAVLFEYPTAVVGAALFAFLLIAAHRRLRLAAAFTGGAILGAMPIALYNAWAFGSAFHLSYSDVIEPDDYLTDTPRLFDQGTFGFSAPRLDALAELLVSSRGLLVTTPIVAAGAVGIILLSRSGRRAEAWLLGGASLATLTWNAGFTTLYGGVFGGDSPGARYLVAVIPLLFLPLGLVFARAPGVVSALAVISMGFMAVVTSTRPQVGAAETAEWRHMLLGNDFTQSPLSLAGAGNGWLSMAPFFIALGCIGFATWRLSGSRLTARDSVAAFTAVVAWVSLLLAGPRLLTHPGGTAGALLALIALSLASLVVVVVSRRRPRSPSA